MVDNYFVALCRTRDYLRKKGFNELSRQQFASGYQRVVIHPSENFAHFMVKSAVVFTLYKRGRPTLSELRALTTVNNIEVTKKKYDVFDAQELNRIGIEDTSPEKDVDVVIKIKQMPMTAKKGLEELRIYVNEMIP